MTLLKWALLSALVWLIMVAGLAVGVCSIVHDVKNGKLNLTDTYPDEKERILAFAVKARRTVAEIVMIIQSPPAVRKMICRFKYGITVNQAYEIRGNGYGTRRQSVYTLLSFLCYSGR